MEEIWKDIKGFEGKYQVSNLGRVRGFVRVKGKILSYHPSSDGYLRAELRKDGKKIRFYVHRLVAQAFISNPDNLPEVNHKDEDKTNNKVDNLEWCTHEYNANYGTAIKRMSIKMINGKNSKTVYQYTVDGQFIKEWPSTIEIKRRLGYNQGNIAACCRGERHSAYGFKWSYA